jgi:flagellar biosynthesis/type III secretory pathway M-ring protein FliF/YscJ
MRAKTDHDDDALLNAPNYWVWVTRVAFGLVIFSVIFGIMANFVPKIHEAERAKARLAQLKETESTLRVQRDRLQQRKQLIATNEEFQQQRVRDRIAVKLTGEEIFRFEKAEAAK